MTSQQQTQLTKDLTAALGGVETARHAFEHAAQIRHEAGDAVDTADADDDAELAAIAARLRTLLGMAPG